MISKGLSINHIFKAVEEILIDGIPKNRNSTKYDLIVDEIRYPPKYVISIAYKFLIGKELSSNDFDAFEAKKYLIKLGFKVIRKNTGIDKLKLKDQSTSNDCFDDYEQTKGIYEGALKKVSVNKYERSNKARSVCLKHHGYKCKVCDFDFEKVYGEIGKGFIHVHHKIDLATISEEYKVDPINDLIPVCPNCHAMLHKKKPAYTIEKLKEILNE